MPAHPDYAELNEILDGCLEAIDQEIDAVRAGLSRRGLEGPVQATGGHRRRAATGLVYEWQLEPRGIDVRPDDAVRISSPAGNSRGFVVGYDRNSGRVRISATEWLGTHAGHAELEFDPTWLLTSLADRLRTIGNEPEAYSVETALRLLGRSFPRTGSAVPTRGDPAELNDSQRAALARIVGSDTQFVWGPPGTGKTRLLGHAAAELATSGRVLVVATTNAAVDEAAQRTVDSLGPEAVRANRIIRIGAGFSPGGDPDLSVEAAVARREGERSDGLLAALDQLEREMGVRGRPAGSSNGGSPSLRARIARLVGARDAQENARREAVRLSGRYQRAAHSVISGADVILTTLARFSLREDLGAVRFESMIVDEASAAPLPYLVLAAAHATARAVAIGDFQQLPAVVASRDEAARHWLSRNVFEAAGIIESDPEGRRLPAAGDRLCAMLSEQYRMHPAIRAIVSDQFYGGRLGDAPALATRRSSIAPLAVVDTSGRDPTVEREEGSRSNVVHLETVLSLLELLAREGVHDVAVVTPYRLQSRRLRRLVRTRLGGVAPSGLEISTIHSFQGREKDVIVFDTVDAPPAGSWFLDETRNRDFPTLLNVAISRSRHSLIMVGAVEGLRQALPEGALLLQLLDRVARDGITVDPMRLLDSRALLFPGA